jgi:integrase
MSDDFYLHPLSLPPRPNLGQYKKLARDLQHGCKLADPGAIRQWAERSKGSVARLYGLEITPQVRNEIDREARRIEQRWHEFKKSNEDAGRCTLAHAQLFVARAHGFASWPKFASHVKELARENTAVSNFETAAGAFILRDATTLLADCGLRPDECFRLRWEHIRDEALHVPFGKTENARRTIPLTQRAAAYLEMRRAVAKTEWVFPAGTRAVTSRSPALRRHTPKPASSRTLETS